MSAQTGTQLKEALAKVLGSSDTTATGLSNLICRQTIRFQKFTADAMAADTATWAIGQVDSTSRMKVVSVVFVPQAALTADPTNNATWTVMYNNGAGGANTVAGSTTTGTTSWTAYQPVTLPLTAANTVMPAGSVILFQYTKGGSGVVVPSGSLEVILEMV